MNLLIDNCKLEGEVLCPPSKSIIISPLFNILSLLISGLLLSKNLIFTFPSSIIRTSVQ